MVKVIAVVGAILLALIGLALLGLKAVSNASQYMED